MKFVFQLFAFTCLLAIVSCGTKDSAKAVNTTKEVKPVKEVAPVNTIKIKETATVAETASNQAMTEKTSPKIVEKAATKEAEMANKTANKKASTVQKVAVKNPAPQKKKVVEQTATEAKAKIEGAKKVAQSTTTKAKENVNVRIEGATKVAAATATTVKNTAPKVVEAATEKVQEKTAAAKKEVVNLDATVDHSAWDQLLRQNVSAEGKVNYKAIKANKTVLEAYLKSLDVPVKDSWSRSEKMAYWINAYNAHTVKLIVDNYPIKSITDLDGGKPWDRSWITLAGKTYSLNHIEHKIIRPQFKDARIHFAVNCAASSCPPILNKAWTAKNLESTLDRQAKLFINSSKYNNIASDQVSISKLFDWYKEDFGDVISYLNKYANTTVNSGAKVSFKEYDWALNE